MFRANNDLLLISYQNINILHKRPYMSPSLQKNIGTLNLKGFSKHPLFTTFSIFLLVSVRCVISQINTF